MKALALGLVLAAVLVGAYFALSGDGVELRGSDVTPEPQAAALLVEAPAKGAPSLGAPQRGETAEPIRAAVPAAAPVADPATGGLVLSDPDPNGMDFEVVIQGSGAPLPGALLTYLSDSAAEAGDAERLMRSAGGGIDHVLDVLGRHYTCDEQGRVRLGGIDVRGFLRARGELAGVRYSGLLQVDAETRRIEVSLEAGFDVLVVDLEGAPVVGIPVELFVLYAEGPGKGRRPLNSLRTDIHGRVFLPNVLAQLGAESERMVGEDRGGQVFVGLAGLFAERPQVAVDWRTSLPREVKLVRPPVGRVVVSVHDQDGAAIGAGYVSLGPAGTEWTNRFTRRTDVVVQPLSGSLEPDPVVFEAVELGHSFDAHYGAKAYEDDARAVGLVVTAPDVPVSVDLVVEVAAPWLVGRAFGANGTPLAEVELHFGSRRYGSSAAIRPLGVTRTTSDGTFEVRAPWYRQGDLVAYVYDEEGREVSAEIQLFMDVPPSGRLQLGNVILEPLVLLAVGRVVDSGGGGLSVPLRLDAESSGGEEQIVFAGAEASAEKAVGIVYALRSWQVVSEMDGHFEFHGRSSAPNLALSTSSDQYVNETSKQVPNGARDIVLVLERAGHFRFQLPETLKAFPNASSMSVEPIGALTSSGRLLATTGVSPPLAPGVYQVQFLLGWSPDEVLAEQEVVIVAGEVTDLGEVRFTHPFHHYAMHVTTANGVKPSGVQLAAYRLQEDHRGQVVERPYGYLITDFQGDWQLFTIEPVSEVRVVHHGTTTRFPISDGDNVLTLQNE